MDAAASHRWVHEPIEGDAPGPRYSTQRRWLKASGRMLGLDGCLSRRTVEEIVEDLDVPGIEHAVLRQRYLHAPTLVGRGCAVAELLDDLELDAGLLWRILAAGHRAGLWGRPRVYDVDLGQLVCPLSVVARYRRGAPALRT